jgi:glycosyltransferase involved in cell wall biosynthesis
MKILSLSLVYPNPEEPGLGLFVRARLQALARLAEMKVVAPVAVLDYSNPKQKWFGDRHVPVSRTDEQIEVLHPRWLYPPGGTPWNVLCLVFRLLPTLLLLRRRFRFDLIDAHFGYPEGVVAALLSKILRCPFMVTLRGSEMMFAQYRYRRWCLRWALRQAAAVVTVSEQLRKFAIRMGADPARTRTIPNGIDAQVFYPRDRERCRAHLGIGADTRVIVSAGELIEAKGHHLVIQAARDLVRGGTDVMVLVAGGVARGGRP